MTRGRRGGIQRGESSLVSNHFPMCSPQPGILRDSQSREEKGEVGDRGDLGGGAGRRGKRGENNQPSNHTPK